LDCRVNEHRCHRAQAYFRPELLNRLDEIVVFRQLAPADTRRIAQLVLEETAGRLAKIGIGLDISPALMRLICERGYSQVRAPVLCM
jgi:ATP-dependent Clp protease ATP-binding subunit ClpC